MAFPLNPGVNDTHTEGGISYVALQDGPRIAWTVATPAAGVTLALDTDTTSTTQAATPTNVANQVAAGLDDLDTSGVDAVAIPNVSGATLLAQLQDMVAQIQANKEITGNHVGTVSTNAALEALADVDGAVIENGDTAILSVAANDNGQTRPKGVYVYAGGAWPLNPALEISANIGAASLTAAGVVELMTDVEAQAGADATRAATGANLAAVEPEITNAGQVMTLDRKIAADQTFDARTPSGTVLPADNVASNDFIYTGVVLPQGKYYWNGNAWTQGG